MEVPLNFVTLLKQKIDTLLLVVASLSLCTVLSAQVFEIEC